MARFYWRVRAWLNRINPWFQQRRYDCAIDALCEVSMQLAEQQRRARDAGKDTAGEVPAEQHQGEP